MGRPGDSLTPHDYVARIPEGAQARKVDWTKLLPPSLGVEIQAIWQVGLAPLEHPNPSPSAALSLTLPGFLSGPSVLNLIPNPILGPGSKPFLGPASTHSPTQLHTTSSPSSCPTPQPIFILISDLS